MRSLNSIYLQHCNLEIAKLKSKIKMAYNPEFMKEAIRIAVKNVENGTGGPIGAVVVRDGKIIATSGNTVVPDNDPTAHAEVNAIRKACKQLDSFQLKGCEIYSSCEPCPMCLGAIYWARPERVDFYQKEAETRTLLPSYTTYDWKQLQRMTHVEVFDYDVLGNGEKARMVLLFDYQKRDPLTGNAEMIDCSELFYA